MQESFHWDKDAAIVPKVSVPKREVWYFHKCHHHCGADFQLLAHLEDIHSCQSACFNKKAVSWVSSDARCLSFFAGRVYSDSFNMVMWSFDHLREHQTTNPIGCMGRRGWIYIARWWFETFFIFTPIWGRFPIWRAYFSDGLVQPPTRY